MTGHRFRRSLGVGATVAAWVVACAGLVVTSDEAVRPRLTVPAHGLALIRQLAIQHNGRHKPFDSFSRETLESITGSRRWHGEDPVVTVLSIVSEPEQWQDEPLLAVPFVPLREALGLERNTTHVSYNQLVETRTLMRLLPPIAEKQQRDEKLSMLDHETWDAFQRFVALNGLFEQRLSVVPPDSTIGSSWSSILTPEGYTPDQRATLRSAWDALLSSVRSREPAHIDAAALQLSQTLRSLNPVAFPAPWRLQLEVGYHQLQPFRVARVVYFFTVFGFLLSLMRIPGWARSADIGLWLAFLCHGAGIAMRVILGGRPPVSNFYETMLWLPFVGVALALVFERIRKVGYFGLAASILASITLLLADHVPLDSSIAPVVAVLRSPLWLTIHVLTIVASYGALALATVLAHIYGWLYLVRSSRHHALATLDTLLYRMLQVGVVLLAGGIMLGAVWANASWGRYWGWDPKETWALITLLWFLAVFHGRFAGWLYGIGVALSTIGGFFLLLMTYYGVSFYLVGLHSYAGGHATPLPILLVSYLIAEVMFLLAVGFVALRRQRLPQP
jgi:cytochrome c-type biogenesis protein CcsB